MRNFQSVVFADFLEIVLHTSEIFEYRLDWTNDLIIRYVTSMVEGDQFSTDSITNDIIQFDDYYVKNGVFIEADIHIFRDLYRS